MKILKLLNAAFLSFILIASPLLALGAPSQSAKPAASRGKTFVLNQASLQSQLLRSNLDLIRAMNEVHMAKDNVNIARANLLPSLNLGALLSFSAGGFLLASIDLLVPFLLPSNWLNYSTEKAVFEAEKLSYNIIQLNVYSSAVSLYFTILADRQIQQIYQQQYHDLQDIFEMQKKRAAVGLVPISDLMQTQAQAQMAGVKASQLAEMNKQEIASVRKFLSLGLDTGIVLEDSVMADSSWEYEGMQAAANKANAVSLERAQIQHLIKAAESQKWSKVFGFMNSMSVSSRSDGVKSAGFDNMTANGSLNLSFAQFPTYELNERRIEDIRLQDKALQQENLRIIESTLGSLVEARNQVDLSTHAEIQMSQVYEMKRESYEQGVISLIEVLEARNQMADSSVAKVKSILDANLQRVVLHRTLRSAQFGTIKGCSPTRTPPETKKVGVIGRIIGKKPAETHTTLDQICRGK